jgi:hypothetical protein
MAARNNKFFINNPITISFRHDIVYVINIKYLTILENFLSLFYTALE